nr:MAG TPA: hypothetical protein [Caudoviricetes sp.]
MSRHPLWVAVLDRNNYVFFVKTVKGRKRKRLPAFCFIKTLF